MILALIVPALRDRVTAAAAGLGAVIALVATPFLPAGLPVLLALAAMVLLLHRQAARGRPGANRRPAQAPVKAEVQAR